MAGISTTYMNGSCCIEGNVAVTAYSADEGDLCEQYLGIDEESLISRVSQLKAFRYEYTSQNTCKVPVFVTRDMKRAFKSFATTYAIENGVRNMK